MDVTFRPIDRWPTKRGLRSAAERERSRFDSGWSQTLGLLTHEIGRLGARSVVVKLALEDRDIRRDGWPKSKAKPEHPGVVVEWLGGAEGERWSRMAADKFDHWQDNMRAVALSLEALRGVERWGAVEGEQYEGLQLELEAPRMGATEAQRVLTKAAGEDLGSAEPDWRLVYRRAAARTHPDNPETGDREEFERAQEAWRVLGGGRA